MKNLRVVVGGYLGLLPAGGVTWDYVQYPVGFAELGCDVFYIEDTRLWPVYQAEGYDYGDATPNVQHLAAVMDAFGLGERWAYRDEASGQCFGLSEARVFEILRTADVFVNVSCSTCLRDEHAAIPARVLIDSDPMFTQIQLETQAMFTEGEPALRRLVEGHTHHFTFGEHVGAPDCRMPDAGIHWRPTRQPVCLDHWVDVPTQEPGAAYSTVMNWTAAPPLEYAGETWGQKDVELRRFFDLPGAVPGVPLAVAVGQTTGDAFPRAEVEGFGWRVLDPAVCVPDWQSYRDFIGHSRGEFAVAKETYVKGRTGWFSCRSACYLAAGRPVVTQDTGWSEHIPSGEGLVAFSNPEEAAEALRAVELDYAAHAKAARRVATEYFDSREVLSRLLSDVGA